MFAGGGGCDVNRGNARRSVVCYADLLGWVPGKRRKLCRFAVSRASRRGILLSHTLTMPQCLLKASSEHPGASQDVPGFPHSVSLHHKFYTAGIMYEPGDKKRQAFTLTGR